MNDEALNISQLKNEFTADSLLPYSYHYSDNIIKTDKDTLIQIYEVDGLLFETADNDQINAWHRQFCQTLLNIGITSSDITLYHWMIKETDVFKTQQSFAQEFAQEFYEQYAENINESKYFVTRHFFAICIRSPYRLPKILDFGAGAQQREHALIDCAEKLESLSGEMELLPHGFRLLSTYENEDGVIFSAPLEVLFRVLNGYWSPVALEYRPIKEYLATSRLLFGTDAYEIRTPDNQIYGAALAFRQYASPTHPLMLQHLLQLHMPFTLCQSFQYEDSAITAQSLALAHRQMQLSKDVPQADIDAMNNALDDIKGNRIYFGKHHLTLFVYMSSDEADDSFTLRRRMNDRISQAKSALQRANVIVAREDVALPSAHYAQMPDNHIYRPRIATINTLNFAGFCSLHTTPMGTSHSYWPTRDGRREELLALKSTSGGLYRFNCHDGELGHTLIIGRSGSGKTVLMGTLATQFDKYGANGIIFDKDCGQEGTICALNGKYHRIQSGVPTGFNPYLLDMDIPENLTFIQNFTLKLAYPEDYPAEVANRLNSHLRAWYARKDLPPSLRRLSELWKGLQDTDLKERLAKWVDKGSMAWLFDNVEDTLDLNAHQYIGIDTSDILKDPLGKTPFFMYLLHRVDQSLTGHPTFIMLDEMWKMLDDPYFEVKIKDWLKTLRKKNALLIGATQDADDISKSNISSTLIAQCPTHIFYPNFKANWSDYKLFNLSENEFTFVKESNPERRLLLIKQGMGSVIADFRLNNMDKYLHVISGRAENLPLLRQAINDAGTNPKDWLPIFYNSLASAHKTTPKASSSELEDATSLPIETSPPKEGISLTN